MISYDLIAGRRLSAPPQVRYTDRPEEWRISCTGRALRPVTSWRAVIATARKIDATTVIAETTEGIAASGVDILVLLDVFFASFRDAVAGAEKGRELWFALWGFAANGKSAEYLEFTFTGFPAIDPPGEDPKDLPIRPTTTLNGVFGSVTLTDGDGNPLPVDGQKISIPPFWPNGYYTAREVNELFCFYVGARSVVDIYDGEARVALCPLIPAYDLIIPEEEADVNVVVATNYPDFVPACNYLWLHIDKKSTGNLTFSPGIHWLEGDGAYPVDFRAYSDTSGIDFTSPGMYRLLLWWSPEYDDEPAHWYNFSEENQIER